MPSLGVRSPCYAGIPEFREFTIRDPRYSVIWCEVKFHNFEEKKMGENFSDFFVKFLFIV